MRHATENTDSSENRSPQETLCTRATIFMGWGAASGHDSLFIKFGCVSPPMYTHVGPQGFPAFPLSSDLRPGDTDGYPPCLESSATGPPPISQGGPCMNTQAAMRPRAVQTHIGFLPDGRCAPVCYWEPIDAFLWGRCEGCTAGPVRLISGRRTTREMCIRFVPPGSAYDECFG